MHNNKLYVYLFIFVFLFFSITFMSLIFSGALSNYTFMLFFVVVLTMSMFTVILFLVSKQENNLKQTNNIKTKIQTDSNNKLLCPYCNCELSEGYDTCFMCGRKVD